MSAVEAIKRGLEAAEYLAAVDNKDLVQWADDLARTVQAAGLKTSQIRKFLDGVRKVDLQIKRQGKETTAQQAAVLLKIHLVYAAARQRRQVQPLADVLSLAIEKIRPGEAGREDFEKFLRFVEGVIAYHRFYGGD
ncbi:MAG: type III-A CRISPR-associated protein Csm2 [bacterium]|jgi:CRISPR-associated protein Csm2|nr:type III-A CRISPR-associated protein Csm2 [Bacillota bacterium]HHW55942.1 type III-A CRISPR-associated protein Csm2 [Bacillota bacterium]